MKEGIKENSKESREEKQSKEGRNLVFPRN